MAARSYYRLRFERGEIIEMYGWTAGKVTAIESGLAEAATTQFVPESAATLASFDPLTGRIVRIGVTTAPDGSIAELTVANPAGTIHARRG